MFDLSKFEQATFQPRTAEVEVPALADFFPKGEKPVWKVRGLSGIECARMREAGAQRRDLQTLVAMFAGSDAKDAAEAVRQRFGLDDGEVPEETSRHLYAVVAGSVEPKITHEVAVKLNESHHGVFLTLAQKILRLTGEGYEPGKRRRSTPTPEPG